MPSTSSLTSSEKSLIKKHAATGASDKIHAAAIGRIYYAYPDPAKWSYSGISGAVVFGWGSAGGWLKVVDLAGTRGVIWQHGVVEDLPYYQDRTFFHTFPSDDCMIGIAFSSESEAADLFKKISLRHKYAAKASGSSSSAAAAKSSLGGGSSSKKKKKGGIDKSMIGAPSGFSHVAHMGFDAEQGFSTRNIDPSWERLFQQLEGQGISRAQIEQNEHFIRNFVEGSGGPSAAPPPSAAAPPPARGGPPGRAPPRPAPPSASAGAKRVPPPAPPSRGGGAHAVKRKPPPPPSRGSAPPPPPPPAPPAAPPSRAAPPAAAPPPPPPPPPARGGAAPPPPPPPPPPARGGPPAPPPPPPPARGGAPPPPPPPPPAAAPGAGGDVRNALLASIQGKGVGNLRKTDHSAADNAGSLAAMGIVGAGVAGAATTAAVASSSSAAAPAADEGGGGDLASALAAALSQRKGAIGDSDDEEESDEDW
ncbi:hypothetical protein Rhopal_006359-T1 [Rhodotorula paludigena]|uniref:Uncharacterized protein n=1 Tax=Rhodotorula paludigena TaxID=86838 RepID=A0AAV5GVE0_9BASI|nr:hypothetical protein Rhopal_006359-T1 [Rhodotorula paludigena]